MPSSTPSKRKSPSTKPQSPATLNTLIQNEISRLSELNNIQTEVLEKFAQFVIENHKKKDSKPKPTKVTKAKPLTLSQLKENIYKHFGVGNTTELKKSGSFQMATSGMDKLDLSKKEGWETLYRKFVGILPGEENEEGHGCINGISIFKYDLPWKVFGLDPQTATTEDVKSAYRELSKVYHPDIPDTGNAQVFDRLNVFYKSLTERF